MRRPLPLIVGTLSIVTPVVFAVGFGVDALLGPRGLALVVTAIAGLGFVSVGLDAGPWSQRTRLVGSFLVAGIGTLAALVGAVVFGPATPDISPLQFLLVGPTLVCFYAAWSIGTRRGVLAFDIDC
ncbi:hypothetical protein [Haloarchaeobius sp. DFWS5]|uniref:hypothetical protein n=1 Tax=Haloarchaeobius sp. DFWS5 TaxID=3446114 RepID=UPI003EBF2029